MPRFALWSVLTLAAGTLACPQPPSTVHPVITVANDPGNPGTLTISGTGFNTSASCANLSLQGLPAPSGHVVIGKPQCSAGSFTGFSWQYSYTGAGCTPGTPASATVFGADSQFLTLAAQPVSIPWGPTCAIAGSCGLDGQDPCPGGTCATGFAVGADGRCTACGAEGQPVCAGNTCTGSDLHLNFQGGIVVCTWSCGHAQGASCPSPNLPGCGGAPATLQVPQQACVIPASGTNLSNGGIWACYDHAAIFQNDCSCVPNTINNCPVSTSITPNGPLGVCTLGKYALASGAAWGQTCP